MKTVNIIELIALFIILNIGAYGLYVLFIFFGFYIKIDTNLIAWSTGMFGSICILYISNYWRDQKEIERVSDLSKDTYKSLLFISSKLQEYSEFSCSLRRFNNDKLTCEQINNIGTTLKEKGKEIDHIFYDFITNLEIINKKTPIHNISEMKSDFEKIKHNTSKIFQVIGFKEFEASKKLNIHDLATEIEAINEQFKNKFEDKKLIKKLLDNITFKKDTNL